jgi:DNA-binding CsgD family transcriptional regulator
LAYPTDTPSALFGRDGELAIVDLLLEEARRGASATAVLSGEPGIGKTALLSAAIELARGRGWQTLSGRAVEVESDLPYGLFADALGERLLSAEHEGVQSLSDGELALLARALRYSRPASTPLPSEIEPDERHRVLATIHKALGAIRGERPLLLALDDLHWADAASIDLVCRLLHRGLGGGCLLLLATRPAQSEPRLRSAFEEAERHGQAHQIRLTPLPLKDAEQLLGGDVEPALCKAIYRESGGNPFYMEHLSLALRRGEALPFAADGASAADLPAAVAAAIQAEIGRLSAPARELIGGAALLGEPFEPLLAAETAGVDEQELPGALDSLLESDLIRPSASPQRFVFRHPIVRNAVYESAGAGWRLQGHRRAARILAARDAPASSLAPHVERSARFGDEQAALLLEQAGRESARRAPASAARWFEAALRLTPQREESLELRLGLLVQCASALAGASRLEDSRRALGELLALCPPQPGPLKQRATIFAAILDELLGKQQAAREPLLEEMAKLDDPGGADAAELALELAFTYFMDADWEAMADWARRALTCDCTRMIKIGALVSLALAELGCGRLAGVHELVLQASRMFEELSDAEIEAGSPGTASWLGWAEICTESFASAARHCERAIAISNALGQRQLSVAHLAVQGHALALAGDVHGLELATDAAVEAALLSSNELFLSWAMALRSQTSLLKGELHAAIRFGERGLAASQAAGSPQAALARVMLAAALIEAGESQRSLELFLDADGQPELPPFPLHASFCFELLVRAELASGRLRPAEVLVQRAGDAARRVGLQLPLAHAQRSQALLLMARGDPQGAAVQARASWEAANGAHAPVEAARSRTLMGIAHAAAGEREQSVSALRAAHEQLIGCGALHYAAQAATQLRKLGIAMPAPATHAGSAQDALGLTPRETEVIERVSSGKTNREIAEALFLSVRTVDRHVSRIFAKLGVSSRAAASSVFERARASNLLDATSGGT